MKSTSDRLQDGSRGRNSNCDAGGGDRVTARSHGRKGVDGVARVPAEGTGRVATKSPSLMPARRPGGSRGVCRRPRNQTRMRQLMNEAFLKSHPEAQVALAKCFENPKTVLGLLGVARPAQWGTALTPRVPSGQVPQASASPPLRTTGKQRGGITGKGFLPGHSGNPGGRPGEAVMRRRLRQSFEENEAQAMAAMARRWASTRHVQDMWELLAKLEGELRKDATENPRGVGLIILNNQGRGRLDPEVFREAARLKALEQRGRLVEEDD
jgi:hypothetical protein